ncbi:MAG: hypothetical protein H6510_08980 [Acidobacteria bacterium]|nr:hypothetical protein [Acidobacteriota bacterium]MCB9397937.1 hypothetical protein [Acidobacteriota bacterium]
MGKWVFIFFLPVLGLAQVDLKLNRPQKLAAVKATSILPHFLAQIVRKHPQELLLGVDAGRNVSRAQIDVHRIIQETEQISHMVNNRVPFNQVVYQMGFVSGLLSVYLDPSTNLNGDYHQGFQYLTNQKLSKLLFVFPGYAAWGNSRQDLEVFLRRYEKTRLDHQSVLQTHYAKVNQPTRALFDDRHPVFGVASIYFSNLSGVSARLWRYAWDQANGDQAFTPLEGEYQSPVIAPAKVGK